MSKLDRSWSGISILIDDIEVTDADIKESSSAKTALYVVRRNAGENHDRRAKKGDYYLSDREMDNIKKVAASFEHTIIILNTCVMDANFIEEIEGIDAALLLGQAGMEARKCAGRYSDRKKQSIRSSDRYLGRKIIRIIRQVLLLVPMTATICRKITWRISLSVTAILTVLA